MSEAAIEAALSVSTADVEKQLDQLGMKMDMLLHKRTVEEGRLAAVSQYEIENAELEYDEQTKEILGKGASGECFKATWVGRPCAIKEITKAGNLRQQTRIRQGESATVPGVRRRSG